MCFCFVDEVLRVFFVGDFIGWKFLSLLAEWKFFVIEIQVLLQFTPPQFLTNFLLAKFSFQCWFF
jgi:hypothetical protein